MIKVDIYDSITYGYHDDCDYVIKFKPEERLLAEEIAEKLSICGYDVYPEPMNIIYCCHS